MAAKRQRNSNGAGNSPKMNRARDAKAAERAAQAYALWIRGWSFSRIAAELGYTNKGAAYKAWERARAAAAVPEDLVAERERERERLEVAYAGLAERIEQGDEWAIDRAIAIADRKAKLLGLDASAAITVAIPRGKRVIIEDGESIPLPPALLAPVDPQDGGNE